MCWKEMEIDRRTGIQNLNAFADIVPTYDKCCGATTFLGGSGYGRLRSRSWLQAKKAAQAPGKKGRLQAALAPAPDTTIFHFSSEQFYY